MSSPLQSAARASLVDLIAVLGTHRLSILCVWMWGWLQRISLIGRHTSPNENDETEPLMTMASPESKANAIEKIALHFVYTDVFVQGIHVLRHLIRLKEKAFGWWKHHYERLTL